MGTPTLTRSQLTERGACQAGVDLFDAHAVNGEIEYTPEIDAQLIGVNEGFRDWLVRNHLIPRYGGSGSGYGDGYGSGYGDGDGDG